MKISTAKKSAGSASRNAGSWRNFAIMVAILALLPILAPLALLIAERGQARDLYRGRV